MRLPAGKLPADILQPFLESLPATDPSVILAARVGEDAAVLDMGGPKFLVLTTDPITFASRNSGRYLLAVNGNDLAVMGAEPRWLLVTVLLPEGLSADQAVGLLEDLRDAAAEYGVALVGGHTEITVGLDRPILVGCLAGDVPRDRLIRTAGARPGDAILLAGGIAIEGTAVLSREHSEELVRRGVRRDMVQAAAGWLDSPGVSVLPAARVLREVPSIHSMHDPTEGGLATALEELRGAAGVGVRVELSSIPVLAECQAICEALGLDPLGLLASGCLIATMGADDARPAVQRLEDQGISSCVIGEVLPWADARSTALPAFSRDELARFLETRADR